MAKKIPTINFGLVKTGDTPTFRFRFAPPYAGFDWSTVTANLAITADSAPSSNSTALSKVDNQALSVDANNYASASITPTATEAANMLPKKLYHVEPQLQQAGGINTPITGTFTTSQDFVKND